MKAINSSIKPTAQTPWDILTNAGQQQAAAGTECAAEMFRGFEQMRKVQEHAAHAAAARHTLIADKLRSPCGPSDVFAFQVELLQFDVQSATQYWQQLGAAAAEMQTKMMSCVGQGKVSGP